METPPHAPALPAADPRAGWILGFVAVIGVQGLAVELSGAGGPLLDAGTALAYACGVLLLWAMVPAALPAPAAAPAADAPLRWTDWAFGSPALFRSPRFRSLTPAVVAMVLAGVFTGGGGALVLAARGDRDLAGTVGLVALMVGIEAVRFLLLWLVTVFLLCLSAALVTGETDFRYMAALCGWGYLALPAAVYVALVYQFAFFPDAAGTDPEVMIPSALLLKAAEVWVVFAVARGIRWADPKRPVAPARAMLVAALPFVLLAAGRLAVSVLF